MRHENPAPERAGFSDFYTPDMKRVAIQGIAGCFHETAARRYFRDEAIEVVPCRSFGELFARMAGDPALLGIAAIENTIAGSLLPNHELLRQSRARIVGEQKLRRIAALAARGVTISFGVDTPCQVTQAEQVFAAQNVSVPVLIEIEVGENRSGVIEEADFLTLLDTLRTCPHVIFGGIFSHDGNSYGAADLPALLALSEGAQRRTLRFAALAAAHGMPCRTVSYGATPTFMNHVPILPGITELRPGTYALMDASQGHAIGTLDRCAATVLATVISKPTDTRTILDVGAKGLTMQSRTEGICAVPGKGTLYDCPEVHIEKVFDEHAIILDRAFHDRVQIGQKVRVIPVHICPVCNLYDQAYLISGNDVVQMLPIAGRGKLQ